MGRCFDPDYEEEPAEDTELKLSCKNESQPTVIFSRSFTVEGLQKLDEMTYDINPPIKSNAATLSFWLFTTEDINNAAKLAKETFGKVDILVNCAGSSKDAGVLEMTDDEWDFTIATDETSVFKMTRAFANIMTKNKYGRIINIASMYGLVGNTEIHTIAYHTSKGAVVNFTRAVAAELATDGITCNAICPGYFETELTKAVLDTDQFQQFAKTHVPMQRYGKPGELDAAAVFLASEEASYVTGLIMTVDGGYTCI